MHIQTVTFSVARRGNLDAEWQDAAAWHPGDGKTGLRPRVAMADGATGGLNAADWAAQLVSGFVGGERPRFEAGDIGRWLNAEQNRWQRDPRWDELEDIVRTKLDRVGSFATFLGCELEVGTPRPRWRALAIGDTVLFHVRSSSMLAWFPAIPADAFGFNPDGIGTKPADLPAVVRQLRADQGELAAGDVLYLATDALACWMLVENAREPDALWRLLAGLDHPATFAELVDDRWRCGELHQDDITLTRVNLTAGPPTHLVVCL